MFDKHLRNTCAKFGAFIQRVTIFLLSDRTICVEVTQADLKYTLCKSGEVGDEYHYLCVCSYFNAERTKCIGDGMILNPIT